MQKKSSIYCKTTSKGIQSFYVRVQGQTYFLFSQNYRRGVGDYFGNSVSIDKALQHSGAKGDRALLHTMEKLPAYIKYVEREYGLRVFRKTQSKNDQKQKCVA